jgi:hypothetical protein
MPMRILTAEEAINLILFLPKRYLCKEHTSQFPANFSLKLPIRFQVKPECLRASEQKLKLNEVE